MKINIEIPDEIIEEGRAIYVMAGIERIAYKLPWEENWHVKISRCSGCGLCCKKVNCEFLLENNACGKAGMRPFLCCISEPRRIETCTSKYGGVQ